MILASGSASRRMMLENAGFIFNTIPADIDERSVIEKDKTRPPVQDHAMILAQAKALFVSKKYPDKMVIGSDQTLIMDQKIYHKANNTNEAIDRLKEFSGKTHQLISAVAIAYKGEIIFSTQDTAHLTMRALTDADIQNYISQAGNCLTSCVGCYAIEGIGIRLFEKISGDYFTILGMPLLPLINFLQDKGA